MVYMHLAADALQWRLGALLSSCLMPDQLDALGTLTQLGGHHAD